MFAVLLLSSVGLLRTVLGFGDCEISVPVSGFRGSSCAGGTRVKRFGNLKVGGMIRRPIILELGN